MREVKTYGREHPHPKADCVIWAQYPNPYWDVGPEPPVEVWPYLRGEDTEEMIDGVPHRIVNYTDRRTGKAHEEIYRKVPYAT